jgi:quercetin dioxygenase-like cupin family protein
MPQTAGYVRRPGNGSGARQSTLDEDVDMPHSLILDTTNEVAIQLGAVVSKVIHRGDGLNVTVFGFDAGEELTEHQAARTAVVQVVLGRLRFTVDGQELELPPGSWLQMTPGTPHSLVAAEPTIMLLTLASTERRAVNPAQ